MEEIGRPRAAEDARTLVNRALKKDAYGAWAIDTPHTSRHLQAAIAIHLDRIACALEDILKDGTWK